MTSLKQVSTWISFVNSLPTCINHCYMSRYSTEDWIRHFEILLLHSIGTEYYQAYIEYYIIILKHKHSELENLILSRYDLVERSERK